MSKMFWCRNCNGESPHELIRRDALQGSKLKKFGLFTRMDYKKTFMRVCIVDAKDRKIWLIGKANLII